jgi:prevent-host-death family protein
MDVVASRDLRNHTADVLRRVAEGRRVAVTVHGEIVAEIVPPSDRRRLFLTREELVAMHEGGAVADPGLRELLRELDQSTEELEDL